MRAPAFALPAALLTLTAFAPGCADPAAQLRARIQEKSTVFATLTPRQQHDVQEGAIERGYTPDMVYMALGKPVKVKSSDAPRGRTEVWTYINARPPSQDAMSGSATSSSTPTEIRDVSGPSGTSAAMPSLSLPDLQTETLEVTFLNDRVTRIRVKRDEN